jgi:hypothetical protein
MKLTAKNDQAFEAHPESDCDAVCVDVTPLKKTPSAYGERETFKLVFETSELRQDGRPYLVWSRSFTPSLHEKSALRAFLKQWFGRDLTAAEMSGFDTDTLIGRTARLSVVHSDYNGSVFANIGLIRPDKSASPLRPSGKYVRVQDRAAGDGQFRRAESGPAEASDWRRVKVHVGRHAGLDLGDLDRDSVEALLVRWLPDAQANPKPLKADRELIAALQAAAAVLGQQQEEDNIPY